MLHLLQEETARRLSVSRREALGRHINVEAKCTGQLTLDETPDFLSFGGEEFQTVDVDLFISEDLRHIPYFHGSDVFSFRSGRRHIFAAVVVDSVSVDRDCGELRVAYWHVELFHRKACAIARVRQRDKSFAKKSGGMSIWSDGEAA